MLKDNWVCTAGSGGPTADPMQVGREHHTLIGPAILSIIAFCKNRGAITGNDQVHHYPLTVLHSALGEPLSVAVGLPPPYPDWAVIPDGEAFLVGETNLSGRGGGIKMNTLH